LTGVTISGNEAGINGGGVHITDPAGDASSTFSMTLGSVTGNNAAKQGGGLWNDAGSSLTLDRVTISENTADGTAAGDGGGGLFNTGGMVDISNSTVSGNISSSEGGGIWNSGTLDASQVTISGNSAATDGGGIFAGGTQTVDIVNSTITLNVSDSADTDAGTGGGLSIGAGTTATIESTIVAGNLEGVDDSDVSGHVTAASQFNLIGVDTNLTGITNGVDNNQIGTATTPTDPLLKPLADDGGPTQTHRLNSTSPAINAGSNPDNLEVDQRGTGFDRTIGSQTDIGAVENQVSLTAVGSGPGGSNVVVSDSLTGEVLANLTPYPGFLGGVRTAVADVNGDGVLDVITGAGPSGGPHVKVFDGDNDFAEIQSFFAFTAGFRGGVFVSAADVNGDNMADLIVGADAGGGPHVRVFSGADNSELYSFFAYSSSFAGGVRVAAGDITGDGTPDIITGAGPGGGPHVRVFDGSSTGPTPSQFASALGSFFAYDSGFQGGVYVSSGDINGAGRDDIITGAGAGGGPHVKVFNGSNGVELLSFFAYDPGFSGGVTVGSTQAADGNGIEDVITGAGPGGGPHLRVFSGVGGMANEVDGSFPFDPDFGGGIFVGGGSPSPLISDLDDLFSDEELMGSLLS